MSDGLEIEAEEAAKEQPVPWKGPYAFRAFRHRNYMLLYTGQLISLTGTWMQGLALPYLVFTLTGSKVLLGLVSAASLLPSLIVTLPSGVIADRFSKRRLVVATQTLLLVQASILAALTFTHTIQVWHIVALAAFSGLANGMDMPTRQAMIVELVGKEDLANAIALNSTMFNLTRIASPFAGGLILAAVGPGWCFALNAVSYLGAIVALLLMRNIKVPKRASRDVPMLGQIGEGLGYVWKNPMTRMMLVMQAIFTLLIGQYNIFFPVYALSIFKVGATGQGMMFAAVGVGALTAAMIISSLGHKHPPSSVVFVGGILAPVGLMALALCGCFYGALLCFVVVGIGMMMFMSSTNTIMQMEAPASLVGRVMSLRALVVFGLGAPGAAMMGGLSEMKQVGVEGTLLACSLVTLLSTLYFVIATRRGCARDELAAVPAEAAAADLEVE